MALPLYPLPAAELIIGLSLPRLSGHQKCQEEYTEKDRSKGMTEQGYRTYTEEFKLEALALLKSSGKSAGQIERELGITPGLVSKWRDRYQAVEKSSGEVSLEPSDLEAAKAEIKRLRRQLAEVEEEREILKKAVNIFSRKSG
jgi:transposase